MAKITVERDGHQIEEMEVRGFLAAGLGEETKHGVNMYQLMIAEGIGEKDIQRMLITIVGTLHKVIKDPALADAIIATCVAKAKLDHLQHPNEDDVDEEDKL